MCTELSPSVVPNMTRNFSGLRFVFIAHWIAFSCISAGASIGSTIPPRLSVHQNGLHADTTVRDAKDKVLSMVIQEGDNLTLSCEGDYPLEWTSDIIPPVDLSDPSLSISKADPFQHPGNTYRSEFFYRDVAYDHTGRFWCRYKNNSAYNDTVYVYVLDVMNLIAPNSADVKGVPYIMLVNRYKPLIVPCRTTHPDVVMFLQKSVGRKLVNVELGEDVLYDPERGFKLLYPNKFFNGLFYCVAKYKNHTSTKMTIMRYTRGSSKPYLNLQVREEVLKGRPFNITCRVRVEPWKKVALQLTHASSEPSDRIKITNQTRHSIRSNGYQYDEIMSTISVSEARLNDSGRYRCTATTDGESYFREHAIHVYDDLTSTQKEPAAATSGGLPQTHHMVKVPIIEAMVFIRLFLILLA